MPESGGKGLRVWGWEQSRFNMSANKQINKHPQIRKDEMKGRFMENL